MNKEWMTGLGLLGLGLATGGLGLIPAAAGLGGVGATGAAAAGAAGAGAGAAAGASAAGGLGAAGMAGMGDAAMAGLGMAGPESLAVPGMFDGAAGLLSQYGKPVATGLSVANSAHGLLSPQRAPTQSPALPQYSDLSGLGQMGGPADLQKLRMARRGQGGGYGAA